ncbi:MULTISPECIES: class I SAM-dependent methyltransferase [Cupriavidus]|uniref:class I SAM-dependent methyltransferase n=1 Tax=Cupriavidus TaxID=106589 RepID=UPI00039BCED8|nr:MULTISPECIES: methyltransferase [Cupriavidus]
MPGYQTKQERVAIAGAPDLVIRCLLDQQQFHDPHGDAERMGISSAAWPLFGMLWPSGALLAERIAARPVDPAERILEIGCGTALASLVAHRRGADVTASDCHPMAGPFLAENARINGLAPMKYRHGHWGAADGSDPSLAGVQNVAGDFDLIIGSDLLYERDTDGRLARYIDSHASAAAEVWIVDPDRGNRPAFNRWMAALGFSLAEQRLDRPAGTDQDAYKGRLLVYTRMARPGIVAQ